MAARANELTADAWVSLGREAVNQGMMFLLLTGGEMFLRPDFFEIYEPLTRMGLMLTLFTNGTLITEAVADRLAIAPPSRIEITLYGSTASTYEYVSGVPGSYDRCCAGIEELIMRNVPLGLKATITRHNVAELEGMQEMARNWGLPFVVDYLLTRRIDGKQSYVEDCRLSPSDCIAIDAKDSVSPPECGENNFRETGSVGEDNFYCLAGKAAFAVNPTGEMNVCPSLPEPKAKPLDTGLAEAWAQVQNYVDLAPRQAPSCRSCDAQTFCPRCPAWSLIETGTLTDSVQYLCQIARARKEHFIHSKGNRQSMRSAGCQ